LGNSPVEQERLLVFISETDSSDVAQHSFAVVILGFQFEATEG
jgi:hypothetical protein